MARRTSNHDPCREDAITRSWIDNPSPYVQLTTVRNRHEPRVGTAPVLENHHDGEENGDES